MTAAAAAYFDVTKKKKKKQRRKVSANSKRLPREKITRKTNSQHTQREISSFQLRRKFKHNDSPLTVTPTCGRRCAVCLNARRCRILSSTIEMPVSRRVKQCQIRPTSLTQALRSNASESASADVAFSAELSPLKQHWWALALSAHWNLQ